MKISQADKWFSKCIKKAGRWTCLRCKKQYQETDARGLDCSHVFGRRHRTVRWCKDNAKPLCMGCHRWWHENPTESGNWLIDLWGEGHFQLLREKRDSGIKVSKLEEKDIAKHYKSQFENMEDGDDFESWQ